MKKSVRITLILFALAVFSSYAHRIFNNSHSVMFNPFYFAKKVEISKHWYYLFLGERISYCIVWVWVVYTIIPLRKHLEDIKWSGINPYLVFAKFWHRISRLVFLCSIIDLIHYVVAFNTVEYWFLIQTFLFIGASVFYLFKSYYKSK